MKRWFVRVGADTSELIPFAEKEDVFVPPDGSALIVISPTRDQRLDEYGHDGVVARSYGDHYELAAHGRRVIVPRRP